MVVLATASDVNPNSGDAWLNRIYTVVLILATLGAFYGLVVRKLHSRFEGIVERIVERKTKKMRKELREHTSQEAAMVRDEVARAVAPIERAVDRNTTAIADLRDRSFRRKVRMG